MGLITVEPPAPVPLTFAMEAFVFSLFASCTLRVVAVMPSALFCVTYVSIGRTSTSFC